MRTTLDIDRDLLDRAKAALGVTTYTEAIERSLEQAIVQRELELVLEEVQGSDIVWSLDEMQQYRRAVRGGGA